MTVLAIDTTRRGNAVLALTGRDGAIAVTSTVDGPLDTGIPSALAGIMPPDLEAVVVLTGPGSYTGVRAGMALALGLATARGVPLHGVGILTAVAAAGPTAPQVTAAVDAGRGGAYAQDFDTSGASPRPASELRRVEWDSLRDTPGVVSAAPGLGATVVSVEEVLGATVPLALAAPPLAGAGLAAVPAPASPGAGRTPV